MELRNGKARITMLSASDRHMYQPGLLYLAVGRMTPDERPAAPARRVHSRTAAFLLSIILADREARSATFGLENPLATRFWTAVKTGTSKEMRDNWCVGYSRRYTVGVWVGNFSGEPMRDVSGVAGAAPVWLDIMNWLHRETPSVPPDQPAGVHAQRVTFAQGTEPDRVEWFLAGTEPGRGSRPIAAGLPRILAPVSGTVIAMDPDIPPSRQRILLEAQGSGEGLRWNLNGTDLGPAARQALWEPFPGRHTLSIADDSGQARATVTFTVRGHIAPPED